MQITRIWLLVGLFFWLGLCGFYHAQSPASCIAVSEQGVVERPWLECQTRLIQSELESILHVLQAQSSYLAPVRVRLLATGDKTVYAEAQGEISISIGFVQACQGRAELAFVLAHELAHLELRHSYPKAHYSSISSANEVQVEKDADRRALALVKAAGYSNFAAESAFLIFSPKSPTSASLPPRFFPSGMLPLEAEISTVDGLPYDGFSEERQAIAERMKLLASRNSLRPSTRLDSLRIPNEIQHQANLALIQAYLMESKPIRALQIWLSDSISDLQMERSRVFIVLQLATLKNALALPMPHGMGNPELHRLESIFYRWTARELAAWALRHTFEAQLRFPQDSAAIRPLAESVALQLNCAGRQTWIEFSGKAFDLEKYQELSDSLHRIQRRTDWPAWKRFSLSEKLSSQLESPIFFQTGQMLESDWFLELKSAYQRFLPSDPRKTMEWFSGRGNLHPELLSGSKWLPMNWEMLHGVPGNSRSNVPASNAQIGAQGSRLSCAEKSNLWDLCFNVLTNPAWQHIPANHLDILAFRKEHNVRYLGVLVRSTKAESANQSQPFINWLPAALEQLPDLPKSKTQAWVVFIDLASYSVRYCLPLNSANALDAPWDYAANRFPF